jgi:amino acid adenylation domain-containing protein
VHFPVSFAQRRLWFLDQLTPGEPTYNMPYAIGLRGPLDAGALQWALDAVLARNAALRTSIVAVDGVPEQDVAEHATVPIERLDVTDLPAGAPRAAVAQSLALDRARRPFDLARGPLLRALLVRTGAEEHLFLLVVHHIVGDGRSMALILDQLSTLYGARLSGSPAPLPPLWMDYGDYAVWQQDRMRGEELDRQLDYWVGQLRGAPAVLTLPASQPGPARRSASGEVRTRTLGPATTRRLATVAHRENATVFMALLTGFAVVLCRYARAPEVVVGTPVAGRTHGELDPLVGLFTNTVALRIPVTGDPTFLDLLARVRSTTLDALAHQELPFETLVEHLAPQRSLDQTPILQTQFIHQSLTAPDLSLPGVTAQGRALFTGTAKLDLSLYADTSDAGTTLVLEYSTDHFDAAWADRFLRCTAHVLAHAARAPGTRAADLPMLSARERGTLLALGRGPLPPAGTAPAGTVLAGTVLAGTALDGTALDGTVPDDIRSHLAASTARVLDAAGPLPVASLVDRASRLARRLAEAGAGPETLVGLCLPRGPELLAGLLATWWAGAAYVPLDPTFPTARLAAIVEDARPAAVLTDTAHRDLAAGLAADAAVLCVDDVATGSAAPLAPVPLPPSALAYVIFTSGSTGRPKGVAVAHHAVANLLASFRGRLPLGPGDRFVAVTTLSFDIALLELVLPLLCGSDLVIATDRETREPDLLRCLITRTGASALQGTPQTWRLLLAAGGVPERLRLRLCGGEALPRDLAEQLDSPGAQVWNLYGPTETTVWSTAGRVPPGAGPVPAGEPLDHTRVYILDDRMVPVPEGVVGEVHLAGRGVARGYHGQPGLTARAFRPDPYGDEPRARMYRTGDLGRWQDGVLHLLGRTDHQIKVRGFRIECGEIESVLRRHRDVRQAAVVSVPRGGEPALVAYVVLRRTSPAARPGADVLAVLRPHLEELLPGYMVPDHAVALAALPLTPNGKVDRAALPAPEWGASRPDPGQVLPRDPVETVLARMWEDLLDLSTPLGVHDNLFRAGAHSLLATRFVARLASAFGVNLAVHHVFATPTVAGLAEVVSADPAFDAADSARHRELDDLSDEDLDALLRAALAQRTWRRALDGA